MFQFTGFATLAGRYTFSIPGCPIQTPTDQISSADPRRFSQLGTSFFASESLGIPHTPLFIFSTFFFSLLLLCNIKLLSSSTLIYLFNHYVKELFLSSFRQNCDSTNLSVKSLYWYYFNFRTGNNSIGKQFLFPAGYPLVCGPAWTRTTDLYIISVAL